MTKVFRIDFPEHATDVFFSSRFFFVVATEMLVVSCTVEDCDEMKKSITQGICYRGMGELLTHFKTGSFFRSFGGCIISLGERDLAKKQS